MHSAARKGGFFCLFLSNYFNQTRHQETPLSENRTIQDFLHWLKVGVAGEAL